MLPVFEILGELGQLKPRSTEVARYVRLYARCGGEEWRTSMQSRDAQELDQAIARHRFVVVAFIAHPSSLHEVTPAAWATVFSISHTLNGEHRFRSCCPSFHSQRLLS